MGLKGNITPNDVLVDPVMIVDEIRPKPETLDVTEDAVARDASVLRNQGALRKTDELNAES